MSRSDTKQNSNIPSNNYPSFKVSAVAILVAASLSTTVHAEAVKKIQQEGAESGSTIQKIAMAETKDAGSQESKASNADEKGKIPTVTVTARKVSENIQRVPVAVTAIDAADLIKNGINVVTEVQQFTPNTTLQNSRATNSTLTAFMRGVGQEDPLWGYEPGVGIYIDDVYMARPQGAVLDIIDVSRIEVLRGPQGTLYGKNTVGGAVKYVTKKMSGDTEFNASMTIGDYGQQDLKFAAQLPIVDDKFYVGVAIADLTRDGYGEFITSDLANQDRENYDKDVFAHRITMEYTPSDDWFARFTYDKTTDKSNSRGGFRLIPSILTDAPVPDSEYDSYTSLPTWNEVEMEGTSLTIEHLINDSWSVKSVTATRENYSPVNIDFDNTSLRIFDVPAIYDDEQFSQEFQLNYESDNLTAVSGIYFYDAKSCGQFDAILEVFGNSLSLPGLTREVRGCVDSKSSAIYSQGSYKFNDKLSMTLGIRYTKEEKDAEVYNGLVFATVYPETGWVPGYVRDEAAIDAGVPKVLDDSAEWTRTTPKIGFEYQQSDETMWFASYSQGFKSGMFNPRASTAEPAVDPEIVDSLEFGVKSDVSDQMRVNATIFSLDHKDRQFVVALPSDDLSAIEQRLGNVGKSEATGAELEMQYIASDQLNFNFSLGLIDSKFSEVLFWDGTGYTDFSDDYTVTNTPDTTANIGFNYDFETGLGNFVWSGNYYYRSDYDLAVVDNLLSQEGYGLANMSLNWFSQDGHWQAGLHVKNLTDERYLTGNYAFVGIDPVTGDYTPGLGGDTTLIGYYGDPRTISFTIAYDFF